MTSGAVVLDVPSRSRLFGSSATQIRPLTLTQGTRGVEWVGAVVGSITQLIAPSGDGESTASPARQEDVTIVLAEAVAASAQQASTRVPAKHAAWQDYVRGRITQMLLERQDAPGYPDTSVLLRTWVELRSVLEENSPTPSIVPSDGPSVAVVWHKGGWDVEIEVDSHDSTVWAHHRRDGTEWYGPLAANRGRLVELLRDMTV